MRYSINQKTNGLQVFIGWMVGIMTYRDEITSNDLLNRAAYHGLNQGFVSVLVDTVKNGKAVGYQNHFESLNGAIDLDAAQVCNQFRNEIERHKLSFDRFIDSLSDVIVEEK